MRYNFKTVLTDLDDKPLPLPWFQPEIKLGAAGAVEQTTSPDCCLGDLVCRVLVIDVVAVDQATGQAIPVQLKDGVKAARHAIAYAIRQAVRDGDGIAEMDVEMVAAVKKLVEKAFPGLYVGPVWKLLEKPLADPVVPAPASAPVA